MAFLNHQTGMRIVKRLAASCFRTVATALVFLVAGLLMLGGTPSQAQPAAPSEYELKAAFLYNFLLFVEWPREVFAQTNTPIRIGVLGDDPFGTILDQVMQNKTVNGRPVIIERLKTGKPQTNYHLLFISRSEKKDLGQILNMVGKSSILTVSEQDRFSELGGVINLTMEGRKVRFEVNLDAAEQSRLKIDPKLLKLARSVRSHNDTVRN